MQALDKKVAAASAQTSRGGDAQCANSTYGKYWVATTYGGYCASFPAIPSVSAQTSNWLDAACPNKEPVEAWRQCAMVAVSAKAEARENTFNEQVAQQQQQAEYQRQLLQQLAEHQEQLLKQQADVARR
jgi:disulfide oxidoreductase YuzD